MGIALIIAPIAAIVGLNIWATLRIIQDSLSERHQRIYQLLIVWFIPILGALIVIYVTRENLGKHSGKYAEGTEAGTDLGSNLNIRSAAGRRLVSSENASETLDATPD